MRRPWTELGAAFALAGAEPVEIDGVTRPAILATGPGHSSHAVGPLGAGRLYVSIGRLEPAGAAATAALGLEGEEPSCRVSWDPGAVGWRACIVETGERQEASLALRLVSDEPFAAALSFPVWSPPTPSDRGPVLVVMVDTLRADRVPFGHGSVGVGEGLADLASDSIVFEHARSSSSWTRPAVATLLTGVRAGDHGVLDRFDALDDSLATLPELFQHAGWITRAWSTNPNVLPTWGLGRGFDVFVDAGVESGRWDAQAPSVIDSVLDSIAADAGTGGTGAGFYYIHLIEPHSPYEPSAADIQQVMASQDWVQSVPAHIADPGLRHSYYAYLAEILGIDRELTRLFDALRGLGVYERATILLVSDHGEEFGDHSGFFHGKTLYEEVVRVPALLKLPQGRDAGRRVREVVDLTDLAVTLLHAAGIPPPTGAEGRVVTARDPIPPRPRTATLKLDGTHLTSIVDRGWKLIVDHQGAEELYDLANDPRELEDLVEQRPEQVSELRTLLEAQRTRHQRGWHVRACGSAGMDPLEWVLDTPAGASVETRRFEDADVSVMLEAPAGRERRRFVLDLEPQLGLNHRYNPPPEQRVRDQDEVVVGDVATPQADGGPVLEASGAPDLPLALGPEATWWSGPRLELAPLVASARVAAGAPVDCASDHRLPRGRAGRPHLRVWYVAPTSRAAEEGAIDESLRARLRALGYEW